MRIKDILKEDVHRPFKIQNPNWKFYQEWNNTIFLHWKVDYSQLRAAVPKELQLDVIEGNVWVSLVAFTMENVRPRYLPSFSPISNFDELNIRTYVKLNGKPGVYFLNIEGGKLMSCLTSKAISKLPYYFSDMKRKDTEFRSRNIKLSDKFEIGYQIGKEILEKSSLDRWLTERYALFQDYNDFINEFDIHHIEWPLREIEVKNLDIDYPRFKNYMMNEPDKIQYSKGVQVIAWKRLQRDKTELEKYD